jgi:hypothetical protein
VCYARWKHAIFTETRVDDPWVFGDVVAPVVGVVVVALLAASILLLLCVVVAYSKRLAMGRVYSRALVFVGGV